MPLTEIRVVPDSLIASQISFNSYSKTVLFSGERLIRERLVVEISVTLVNKLGEFPNRQVVIVYPSKDSSQVPSIEEKNSPIGEEKVVKLV